MTGKGQNRLDAYEDDLELLPFYEKRGFLKRARSWAVEEVTR
jgi:hypothetical protein